MFQGRYSETRRHVHHIKKKWCSFYSKDDVLRGCRVTLASLYLILWPIVFKEGVTNFRVSDDVKLGYIPERIAEC